MVEGLPKRVSVCERVPTTLSSWSLMQAELNLLRVALNRTEARHIAVLSGADYPLGTVHNLVDELSRWEGSSYIWNQCIPFRYWSTPRHRDGGLWRFQHRFLLRGDQVIHVRDIPARWPVKRRLPPDIELRASSQWKIYSRHHVRLLLDVEGSRPDLLRFWKTTLVPEESFAASVLASPSLVGSEAISPCHADAWFTDWPEGKAHHPRYLEVSHFPLLMKAFEAPSISPSAASATHESSEIVHRKLFARKFSTSIDTTVLDLIDRNMRSDG